MDMTMIIFTVLLLGLSAFFFYIAIHAHRKQRRAAEYKEQQIIAEKGSDGLKADTLALQLCIQICKQYVFLPSFYPTG